MNLEFMNLLLDKCGFPDDAKVFFNSLADRVISEGYYDEIISYAEIFPTPEFDSGKMDADFRAMAEKLGGKSYSYWMLMLFFAAERAKPLYDKRGVSDEVFWDTFSDLRSKAYECMEQHDVWGTFVPEWYRLFVKCRIIKFGRLEFEDAVCERDGTLDFEDYIVKYGTKILSIHIPSSGEPFDKEARLKSYKMAYDFYSKELGTDKLVCICGSWLLYPGYKNVFPENSNTRSFMDEFYFVRSRSRTPGAYNEFGDSWRVFGKHHKKPLEELPEDTSMRRNFKKYFLEGGAAGSGTGYLVFDGERILEGKRVTVD